MHPTDLHDIHALREEVSELRSELGALRAARPARRTLRLGRLRRSTSVLALIGLLVAMPMAVSASHVFSDVPTSHTFHTNIANLAGARITTGCTATTYCPENTVTRGQMAGFLNRGLGRAAEATGYSPIDDDWASLGDGIVDAVTLRTGGATGGLAHVWVTGTLSAWTDENGICPCEVALYLGNDETLEQSVFTYATIPADVPSSGYYQTTTTVSHLFTVPTGVDIAYALGVNVLSQLSPSPENDAGYSYSLTAVYLPFSATGANVPALVEPTALENPRSR
jgi:hypothetical protein